jgi:hypothetical protein
MYKLNYPRPTQSMQKVPPSLQFFLLQGIRPARTMFKFEYLREFKNIVGCDSRAHAGSILEKKSEAENLVLLYL